MENIQNTQQTAKDTARMSSQFFMYGIEHQDGRVDVWHSTDLTYAEDRLRLADLGTPLYNCKWQTFFARAKKSGNAAILLRDTPKRVGKIRQFKTK